MKASSQGTYIQSINNVIDYIDKNIQKKLSLEHLAKIAGFSKYHFHRIFSAYMGETLNNFVMRLRAEKVANILCCYPHKSFTEIAFECGFADSAAFTKAFKRRFNLAPNEWVKQKRSVEIQLNKPAMPIFNNIHDIFISASVENLPSYTIAYVRYIGKYAGDVELFTNLFNQLAEWCMLNKVPYQTSTSFCLYHDSIKLTDVNKLRVTVGVEVMPNVEVNNKIGKLVIESARYLVASFKINENQYGYAWRYVFGYLLNDFNVKPASKPSFEMYKPCSLNNGEHYVSICVPLQ
ncbi:AraC family transcriptional regulator [Clostridium sp. 'deep sea']|uniref:AraC family transcriptional regulator n=1 Tax=Clostridium sp. 'deep sea' TaxID=2779445 RepID=UPI00189681A9|nr:AraC family transcriptional regulator [Clostridium sp. 'deep sea']QOR35505.1 AraC family transcriptional regulator [Clostridium sp. 'deep sea']